MTHNQLPNWQNKVPVRVTKHHTQQTHVYTPTPAQVVKLWPVTLCVLTHPQRSSTCDSLGFHQDKKCESNRLEKYWLKTFSSMVERFLQWRLCNGHKTVKVNGLKTTKTSMPRKKRSVATPAPAVQELTPLERLKNSVVCYGWCQPEQLVSILLLRDIRSYVVDWIIQMILKEGWLHVSISINSCFSDSCTILYQQRSTVCPRTLFKGLVCTNDPH